MTFKEIFNLFVEIGTSCYRKTFLIVVKDENFIKTFKFIENLRDNNDIQVKLYKNEIKIYFQKSGSYIEITTDKNKNRFRERSYLFTSYDWNIENEEIIQNIHITAVRGFAPKIFYFE